MCSQSSRALPNTMIECMPQSSKLHALHRYRSMRVMQQAVRRMVKTAQKFARRTAAAIKMQVMPRCLCMMRYCPAILLQNSKAPDQLWPGNICCTQYRWPTLPTKHEMMSHTSSSYTHNVAQRDSLSFSSRSMSQALARGYLGRCEFRRRVAARKAAEDAALAVIKPWGRTAVDRLRFLRLRLVDRLARPSMPVAMYLQDPPSLLSPTGWELMIMACSPSSWIPHSFCHSQICQDDLGS